MTENKLNIRLSHSALSVFHTCERLFQLDRLLEGSPDKQDYPATVMGKAFGEGVAHYLLTQDTEAALWKAYLAYYPILEDNKRTEEIVLNTLICAFPKLDDLLLDWELASFQGKPAVELSFSLENLSSYKECNVHYVGYIDAVLKNKWTGKYAILENKTTSLGSLDIDPLFKNSGQALGYSIVLDRIAGEARSEYAVIYCIAQANTRTLTSVFSPTIHIKEYPKTLQDRLNWFISLGMDVNRLEQMLELGVFPMRGSNCMQYMKPCKHFNVCQLQALDRYKDLPPDTTDYQFKYDLQELIVEHLHRSV